MALLEDFHTQYVLGEILYTNASDEVAAWLRCDLFAHHDTPAVMVMDNGLACGAVKDLCHEREPTHNLCPLTPRGSTT